MSVRIPSQPKVVILDEPATAETFTEFESLFSQPLQSAFPGMHKYSNVTLKRGVIDSADGGGSEPPVHATPSWTDHNTHDPGIDGEAVVDDWLM